MKGSYMGLVFIFSAMLNVVFIGSTAWYRLPTLSASGRPPAGCGLLLEELSLTGEQLNQFHSLRERFHGHMSQIGGDINNKQARLIDLLSAPSSSMEDIVAAKEEIRELQGIVQTMLTRHLMENRAIMTTDQYSQFLGLIRGKIVSHCRACPPKSVNR